MCLSLSFTLFFYFASLTWMRFYTQWVWEFSLDIYCVAPGGLVPFLRTSFGAGFGFQWLHHAVRWYSSYLSCFCDKNTLLKQVKEEVVYFQGKQLLSSLFLFKTLLERSSKSLMRVIFNFQILLIWHIAISPEAFPKSPLIVHVFEGRVHHGSEGMAAEAWESWSHGLHSLEAERGECWHSLYLSFYQEQGTSFPYLGWVFLP